MTTDPDFVRPHGADTLQASPAILAAYSCLIVKRAIPAGLCASFAALARRTVAEAQAAAGSKIGRKGSYTLGIVDTSRQSVADPAWPEPLPAAAAAAIRDELYVDSNDLFANTAVTALARTILARYLFALFEEPYGISYRHSRVRLPTADNREARLDLHQDAASGDYGDSLVVTAWIPLVPCGVSAPGLSVLPEPQPDLLPRQPDGELAWAIERAAAQALEPRLHREAFEAGDLLLFRQDTVHGTHVTPGMADARISIDVRAFALSAQPPIMAGSHLAVSTAPA